MYFLEFFATLSGILYVYFSIKKLTIAWFFSFLSSITYIYIFYFAELYLSSLLSVVFTFLTIFGYLSWKKSSEKESNLFLVSKASVEERVKLFLFSVILSLVVLTVISITFSYNIIFLGDSIIWGFSIVSSILAAKKILDCWLGWIIVNSVGVITYFFSGLKMSALLYLIYLVMAVYGYKSWKKELK